MNKFTKTAIAMIAMVTVTTTFAENPNPTSGSADLDKTDTSVGATSDNDYAKKDLYVGISKDLKAGVNIYFEGAKPDSANNKFTSFDKISSKYGSWHTKKLLLKSDDDVFLTKMYDFPTLVSWIPGIPEHRDTGRMAFKQVGDQDVWFGDWDDHNRGDDTPIAGSNSVFYSGTNQSTLSDVPSSNITYNVTGINRMRSIDAGVLKGTLTANFNNSTLEGDITRYGSNALDLNIDAKIKSNAQGLYFKGNAIANDVDGDSEGKFFGAGATGVAGIATFEDNKNYNTAFGGTKN